MGEARVYGGTCTMMARSPYIKHSTTISNFVGIFAIRWYAHDGVDGDDILDRRIFIYY